MANLPVDTIIIAAMTAAQIKNENFNLFWAHPNDLNLKENIGISLTSSNDMSMDIAGII